MISSNLLGLPWQHGIYDRNFKQFFLTIMFCLYSVSKNSKIIQTFIFSEIVRPKMGFIDPSPFNVVKTFKNVFLIIFGFFCCQDYFAHSEPSQSSFRAKMIPDINQSLGCLSHAPSEAPT